MTESTRAALRTFGFEKEEWRKELQKEIADDQLITTFGGTRRT
jgi:hypothetical protein